MAQRAFELRPATPDDAPAIVAITSAGFDTYRSFAPDGWEPPAVTVDETAERLARPASWGAVATSDGEIVGVGIHVPARESREGPLIEGLAHVAAVFVAQPWWGRGVAPALLAALTDSMRAAGYREGRLFTPAGQARARAFYAREGWREVAGPTYSPDFGLDLMGAAPGAVRS